MISPGNVCMTCHCYSWPACVTSALTLPGFPQTNHRLLFNIGCLEIATLYSNIIGE